MDRTEYPQYDTVDIFSGAGGWDIAAERLGMKAIGVENNQAACDTRRSAGIPTVDADVRSLGPGNFPNAKRLIGSPPCQTFSSTGCGSGRAALSTVLCIAKAMGARIDVSEELASLSDERTGLVLEPLRWAFDAMDRGFPFETIVLEQVPTVLPGWAGFAELLRAEGYSVDTGCVSSEEFGVPQTRKRAVLVARLDTTAALPTPTHRKYRKGVPQPGGDPALLPWLSMSDAGVPEEVLGGCVQRSNYSDGSGDGRTATERGRTVRRLTEPSVTITGKGFQWENSDGRYTASCRESAAIQTFPPDYPWTGRTGEIRQQIGNAVPPTLAYAVLRSVV